MVIAGELERDPDAMTLARCLTARLLGELGVSPGSLTIAHADAAFLVARALEHGSRLELARVCNEDHCRVCGCTAFNACRPEPCARAKPGLCTACAAYAEFPR